MTEQEEWRRVHSASRLLEIARKHVPIRTRAWWNRKQRLAACGCYRLVWDQLPDDILRTAVAAAEDFADGRCPSTVLEMARLEIVHQAHWLKADYVYGCIELADPSARKSALSADQAARHITWFNNTPFHKTLWNDPAANLPTITIRGDLAIGNFLKQERPEQWKLHEAGMALHGEIFRDVFGDPFRPVVFDRAWRTETARLLARQMYESRDFSVMPILADALQDAGCTHDDVLNHCRDQQVPHVRGCWVIDFLINEP